MEDNHMWLIPFCPGEDHLVTIHFIQVENIAGLRIWNYNKSPEDTYRGVRPNAEPSRKPQVDKYRSRIHWQKVFCAVPPLPSAQPLGSMLGGEVVGVRF